MDKRRSTKAENPTRFLIVTSPEHRWNTRAILQGFNAIAATRRWLLRMAVSDADLQLCCREWQPDGLLLVGDVQSLRRQWLARLGIPIVSVDFDRTDRGIPSVVVDGEAAGVLAARHLLATRGRHFAAFAFDGDSWCRPRVAGFRRAIEAAGKSYLSNLEHIGTLRHASQATFMIPQVSAWLRQAPRPLGLMVPCDPWAQGLACICLNAGLRIPEDITLLGMDNDDLLCAMSNPPLSSVALPWKDLGSEAARLLERLLHDSAARPRPGTDAGLDPIRVRPRGVVIRHSSDILHVADPDVAAVLRYIRRHARTPIYMSDLYRAVPVARHRIERGFRRLLGRTVTQEIRRVHVEEAKRLLEETDLGMSEVAQRSGFADASKLAIHFHRQTGQTASAYRQKFRSLG